MQVSIDLALKTACPLLALGLVRANVRIGVDDAALWTEIAACTDDLRRTLAIDDVSALPQVKALRQAYRALGKDPARYRGSQEALLRRILKGNALYRVNTVVDINNLVSIESRHSLGSYDLDCIDGHVILRVGRPGETYKGIGKDVLNLECLPVYCDASGPFGSPTSDGERAMITAQTTRILMVATAFSGAGGLEATLERAVTLLRRYAQADGIETKIV